MLQVISQHSENTLFNPRVDNGMKWDSENGQNQDTSQEWRLFLASFLYICSVIPCKIP